ncbi:MAG: SDR family oxidoreductase [Anaerolineales bacterium]
MAVDLKDKVVLITGASSGFGEDAARLFAKEGCKVVVAARRIERLQTLAASIQDEGGEAIAVPMDVTNHDEINYMIQTAVDLYGHIDILFNNAGFGHLGWLENLDPDRDIETQIQVNLTGLIQTTRAVLPYMLKRQSGHIINMSSVAGWIAPATYSIYSATKFGVRGFTDALRREVQPFGVRVSGIYPGPAATEFSQHTGNHPMKKTRLRKAFPPMSSAYVAQRVVDLAKHPRRTLIIPWFYRIAFFGDRTMPWLVDWIVMQFLTKRKNRRPL